MARAFRDGARAVELLSDDPAASGEIAAYAAHHKLSIMVTADVPADATGSTRFVIGA